MNEQEHDVLIWRISTALRDLNPLYVVALKTLFVCTETAAYAIEVNLEEVLI